jgi:hypothetical protein
MYDRFAKHTGCVGTPILTNCQDCFLQSGDNIYSGNCLDDQAGFPGLLTIIGGQYSSYIQCDSHCP